MAGIEPQVFFCRYLRGCYKRAKNRIDVSLAFTGVRVRLCIQLDAVGTDLGCQSDLLGVRVHKQTGTDAQGLQLGY